MKNINLVFIEHQKGGKKFLFQIPAGISFGSEYVGKDVMCDTMRGQQRGTIASESFVISESVARVLTSVCGAYWPIKSVIGTVQEKIVPFPEYNPADVAFNKPQPTQEPIKLYCVRDCHCAGFQLLSKGKIYDFSNTQLHYDDGTTSEPFNSMDWMHRHYPWLSACLVPLVKRPARTGEYVIPGGEIRPVKVRRECDRLTGCIVLDDGRHTCADGVCINYLVLDGYHPEPAPKYWSGEAICTYAASTAFTVGDKYRVVNGNIYGNDGYPVNWTSVKSPDDLGCVLASKFIEYKGQA